MEFSPVGLALLAFALFMLFMNVRHVNDGEEESNSWKSKNDTIAVLFLGLLVVIYLLNHK